MKYTLIVLVLTVGFFGCTNEQLEVLRSQAAQTETRIQKLKDYQGLVREYMATTTDLSLKVKYAGLDGKLADALKKHEGQAVAISKSIASVQDNWDFITVGVQAALPFLGPWGGVAAIGASLLVPVLRGLGHKKKRKKAEAEAKKGKQATKNIDSVLKDPAFAHITIGDFVTGTGEGAKTKHAMAELDKKHDVGDWIKDAL